MDLKDQLPPSFAEEVTEAQRSEMFDTYTKLFSDLTGPGIQPLTPRPALHKTVEPFQSYFLLPLFKRNVLPDAASQFPGCF